MAGSSISFVALVYACRYTHTERTYLKNLLELPLRDTVTIEDDTSRGTIARFLLHLCAVFHVHLQDILVDDVDINVLR